MTHKPWLSVLMPTFNGEAFLASALDSLVAQRDEELECIVVDDGSTDATIPILEKYQERIPLIIRKESHTGNWAHSTNLALALASGEYVCFLHQDDVWYANRTNVLRQIVDNQSKISLVLGSARFINAEGNAIGHWNCPLPSGTTPLDRNFVMARLLVQNFVPIAAPLFTRRAAESVGGLDESVWYTADWDFWLKMVAASTSLYCGRPLVGFRIHNQSQTVLRSSQRDEFQTQHKVVADRHLSAWRVASSQREEVRKISYFSIEVNTMLLGAIHGWPSGWKRVLSALVRLGPRRAYMYASASRISERATARLRARLLRLPI